MAKTSNMNIRIDPLTKAQADAVFAAIGITTTDGINIFLKKVVAEGGIPFEVKAPNAVTLTAIEEAEAMLRDFDSKKYGSFSELVSEVEKNV